MCPSVSHIYEAVGDLLLLPFDLLLLDLGGDSEATRMHHFRESKFKDTDPK